MFKKTAFALLAGSVVLTSCGSKSDTKSHKGLMYFEGNVGTLHPIDITYKSKEKGTTADNDLHLSAQRIYIQRDGYTLKLLFCGPNDIKNNQGRIWGWYEPDTLVTPQEILMRTYPGLKSKFEAPASPSFHVDGYAKDWDNL